MSEVTAEIAADVAAEEVVPAVVDEQLLEETPELRKAGVEVGTPVEEVPAPGEVVE